MAHGTTTPILGREAELARLGDFLDRVPSGFAALALEGPAGIGKTVLWRATTEMALGRGWALLAAQPAGAEAALSFSGLTDLFGHVAGQDLDALAPVQRRALEVALLRADPGDATVDARTLSSAVLSVLQQLASRQPVLVAVDDLQWLDRPTVGCLAFAFRRMSASPVGFLASARTGSRPSPIFDALGPGLSQKLDLGPLPTGAVEELLARRTAGALQHRVIVRVARQSGGNPFYALEMARDVAGAGADAPSGAIPVPAEVRDLLVARLGGLPARTREALLAAACLDNPRADLVDVDALGRAEEAGLVELGRDGRIRFSHPLIAAAVYGSAAPNRRRAVHRALADRTDDLEERARHLALGANGPDIEVAAQLDGAAKLAHARGSPEAAAELGELALQVTPGGDDRGRAERLLTGAGFHFEAGDLKRAHQLLAELLLEVPDGPLRAHALRLMAQVHFRTGSFREAADFASQALEAAGTDPALGAALEMDITFFLAMQGDFPAALPHINAAIAKARALRDAIHGRLGGALAHYEQQLALPLPDKLPLPLTVHRHNGEPCPRCGSTIEAVFYEDYVMCYCPVCQTDGKVLKDRRLSRLLK